MRKNTATRATYFAGRMKSITCALSALFSLSRVDFRSLPSNTLWAPINISKLFICYLFLDATTGVATLI